MRRHHVLGITLVALCVLGGIGSLAHLEHRYRLRHQEVVTEPATISSGSTGDSSTGDSGDTATPPATAVTVTKTGTNTDGWAQLGSAGSFMGGITGVGAMVGPGWRRRRSERRSTS